MLKYSNNEHLRSRGIGDKYYLFYQSWQELVHRYTLSVYQYRIFNSLNALIELDSVLIKTIEGLFNTNHNVEACKEELLYTLKNDNVLEKYNKPLLNRLQAHLGKKSDKIHEFKALYFQIKYAIAELTPMYLNNLFIELKNEIENRNPLLIEKYSNTIVSQCVSLGWSTNALLHTLRHFSTERDEATKWNDFKNELTRHAEQHTVLLSVFFKSRNGIDVIISALADMGILIKSYSELVTIYPFVANSSFLNANKKYIEIDVDAMDVYSAANTAIRIISDKINMASFYNLITAWDLNSLVIVSISRSNNYTQQFTAKELYATNDYVDISGNIFENTRRIFSDDSKVNIINKLNGAFGYVNSSRASLFQEEKYMNMWIALESLARTDMYGDIISNVKEVLPAALCIRYIYRIIRNFAEDCIRCNVNFDLSSTSINLQQDTKRQLVREIISILQDDTLSDELKSKLSVSSLLLYRYDSIRPLVTDVSYATKKIENHHKRVKWQLQRLYRIRNEIVHSSLQDETPLTIYVEHLYDYLSAFITEIVICLEDKGLSTLEESFCVIKDSYDVFIEFSKKGEHNVLKSNVLKSGMIDLLILNA